MHSPTAERQNWQQRKTQPKSDAKARRRKKKFSGKDESGKRKRIKSKKGNNPNRIWKRHGRQRWSSDVMHVEAAVSVRGACSRKRRKKLFLAGFFPVVFRPAHFVVAQGTCFADCTTQELSRYEEKVTVNHFSLPWKEKNNNFPFPTLNCNWNVDQMNALRSASWMKTVIQNSAW